MGAIKGADEIVQTVVTTITSAESSPMPQGSQSKTYLRKCLDDLKWTFTTREGLIGDYDYLYLFTPNIWPLNKRYKDHTPPFFFPNDKIPLLLTLLLGVQHALTMISGIVSPVLAVANSGFHLDTATTEYLVSAGFITSAIATLLQITRSRIAKTQYYFGTGLLSVVGPTFDIIVVSIKYTVPLYARGVCPTAPDGTRLPCPEAYGKLLGTVLCTVWVQFIVAFIPPKTLNRIFPKVVTGSLLLLCGIYLVMTAAESWGGGAACMNGQGALALCPNVSAPRALPWGHPNFIGIGFATFITIIFVEIIGSPLMKSASIIFGLAVGSIVSGASGYWSRSTIDQAPAVTFLWTQTFKLGVDGTLVLPLMIMFVCEAMTCMPCILATAEMSDVEIEGAKYNSRIQGGILCDAFGSLISTLGTGLPMVSHAGNNGVIVLTSCASRRAGYCAAVIIGLFGIFGKVGGVFASMPASVLGGMQTFLYSTIVVAGLRVIALIPWTRRNRFILAAALGIGLMDIVTPQWFQQILTYSGDNYNLAGFEQGINLIVETPFVIGAVIALFLNAIMPVDKQERILPGPGDVHAIPVEVKIKADC